MSDDEPKKSPEFLDETRPEKNKRSFFEQLLGEESEEKKLRKKLDKELKEAARKRAEQFEEERKVEEKREVSETRKLKKRWRTKLFEKSQKILEEVAKKDDDEPLDGFSIAKVMVAERIVKLYDVLKTEDLRRSEVKSLKIHIDFMGLLSEKLDRPDLEVPKEVEKLYQTIADSVEEITDDKAERDPSVIYPVAEPEIQPASEADSAYTRFAANIVQAIKRVIRPESELVPEPITHYADTAGDGGTVPENRTTSEKVASQSDESPDAEQSGTTKKSSSTERLLSIIKKTALSTETLRKEASHVETSKRLADIVKQAEVIQGKSLKALVEVAAPAIATAALIKKAAPGHENQTRKSDTQLDSSQHVDSPRPEFAPVSRPPETTVATPNVADVTSESTAPTHKPNETPSWRATPEPSPSAKSTTNQARIDHHPTQPTPDMTIERPESTPEQSIGFEIPKNKKIKNMTELELASLAKLVAVGSGLRLYDIYKSGQIDKEGLIKVLESYHKGQDYRREFISRRESWRRHKIESQEYLREQTENSSPTPDEMERNQVIHEKEVDSSAKLPSVTLPDTGRLRNIGEPSLASSSTQIDPNISDLRNRIRKQSSNLLLAGSALLVIILLAIAFVLNVL